MKHAFEEFNADELSENPFRLIGSDWMLITAGTPESFNTMTASWGGMGILWGKKVAFCVIRPQRHTYGFMEKAEHFTLSFFDERYRDALLFCGTHSGRDTDKVSETGLIPVAGDDDTVYFEEARLVLVCRKIYHHDIDPSRFLDPALEENYPEKDYHRMYIGELTGCLRKK